MSYCNCFAVLGLTGLLASTQLVDAREVAAPVKNIESRAALASDGDSAPQESSESGKETVQEAPAIDEATLARVRELGFLVQRTKDGTAWRAAFALAKANRQTLELARSLPGVEQLSFCSSGLQGGWLRGFDRVRSLTLKGGVVLTREALDDIGNLSTLEELWISIGTFGTPGRPPEKNVERWRERLAGGQEATGADLARLAHLPRLATLRLRGKGLTDDDLRHLGSLRALRELWIHSKTLDGSGLKHLGGLGIESLNLDLDELREEHLSALGGLKHLRSLEISDARLDEDTSLAGLVHVEPLESLRLVRVHCTARGLASLSRLKGLRRLALIRHPRIHRDVVQTLAEYPALEELDLGQSVVEEAAVPAFKALSKLRRVHFGRKVSEAQRRRVAELLPDCEVSPQPGDGAKPD